jgi:hypothetical protein
VAEAVLSGGLAKPACAKAQQHLFFHGFGRKWRGCPKLWREFAQIGSNPFTIFFEYPPNAALIWTGTREAFSAAISEMLGRSGIITNARACPRCQIANHPA